MTKQEREVTQAGIHAHDDHLVKEFVERMEGAGDGPAAREAYREGFERLRSHMEATMASLRAREDQTPADARQLRADASELGYIKSQPTADEIILRSIGVLPEGASP